jgi:uncharacterized protein YcbK (DUF882 family)
MPPHSTEAPSAFARACARAAAYASAAALLFSTASASAHEIVHVVARGQTLGVIAKRYHVTVGAIREANGLKPWERLRPGQELTIPGDGPAKGKDAGKKGKADKPEKPEKGKADKPGKKGAKGKEAEKADASFAKGPKRRGYVRLVRGPDKLEVQLMGRRGHLAPAGLTGLGKILRFAPTGEKTTIDARLAALVVEVSDHFGGRPLHVVSGYRPYTPAQYTPHSNHNLGRAMDFSVEGIPNTVLRDYCRTFRNAGVGFYPNSTFVHLDVRAGKAYWVDYSRPGEAPHYDSPGAQKTADESVGEVEPHLGAGAPPAGGSDASPGSPETP